MIKSGFFLGLFFTTIFMVSQNDSIIKNKPENFKQSFKINAKLKEQKIEVSDNVNDMDISYLFFTKKKPLNASYKFDLNKYLNPIEKKDNFMYGAKPLDDDVMVVKHFEGVDTTKKKFKTTLDIGTVRSNTKYVRIEYRDHGIVDGDRVRFYLNEKEIKSNIHLDNLYYTAFITLDDNAGYNRIDLESINQGFIGDNTAEYIIYDDKGNILLKGAWYLKKGEMATLGILKF